MAKISCNNVFLAVAPKALKILCAALFLCFGSAARSAENDVRMISENSSGGWQERIVQLSNFGEFWLGLTLADPNADRILFWDDSAGTYTFLTPGTNLAIVGTTLDATAVGGGSGTVTSVGLSAPAIFSVTGSPVTTSGTIDMSLAVQLANYFWAGPTTGSAAPTFRAIVDGDIPATLTRDSEAAAAYSPLGHDHTGVYQLDDNDLDSVAAGITGIVQGLGNGLGYQVAGNSAVLLATTASFLTADEAKLDAISGTNTGDQTATTVPFTPTGNIAASNTQAAVAEVDTEKQPLLDSISSTRGSILYRGVSAWSALAPSTAGLVLHTNGAGADPTWDSDDGAGGGAPVDATYITQTINGTLSAEQALSALGTGILKNTTTTGVLSIATAGDFPTLNQNTTGSAATLTTPRTIGNVSFDGSANIVPETMAVVDSTDATSSVAIFDSATGSLQAKTDAGLSYNATTGALTATALNGSLAGATGLPISTGVSGLGTGVAALLSSFTIANFDTAIGLTGTPSATTYLRGDGTWSTPSGSGDVTAAAAFGTSDVVIVSDGTAKGVKATSIGVVGGSTMNIPTVNATTFGISDSDASHQYTFTPGNLSANAAITLGAGAITLSGSNTGDQTITLTGDVTGSGTGSFAATVGDDTHAHTGATISGIDISSDTNLAGDTENVLTGDTLSIGAAITRDTEWNTSAKILTAVTDETGTNALVFQSQPTIADPLVAGTSSALPGVVRFQEASQTGTSTITLAAPSSIVSSTTATLPNSNGTLLISGHTLTGGVTATFGASGTTAVTLDPDLSALAALSGTNNIYYRSAADTWSSVTIGSGLTFSAGTLAATGGGFDATTVDAITWSDGANASNIWTFDLSGTDPTITFNSGAVAVGGNLTATNLSGTNTGDQTITLTGDVTGSGTGSFAATVGDDTHAHTGATLSNVDIATDISGLGTGVATLLGSFTIANFDTAIGLTGTPDATTYLRGDGSWATPAGSGDVTAASAFGTDNVLIRSDGTGKGVQATGITVDNTNVMTVPTVNVSGVFALNDSDDTHTYSFTPGNLSANATITLGAGNITISGSNTGDQTGATVSFADTDSNFTATSVGAAIEELDDTNGSGPNAADGKVSWTQLVGVPAGFADGTDDGTGGFDLDALTEATEADLGDADLLGVSDGGTEKKITLVNFVDYLESLTISLATLSVNTFEVMDNVDQSHGLSFVANENLTGDIQLQLDLNGATRTLEVAGNSVLSGTNTGDQTITLTGEVTGTGTGSFATTIADSVSVTNWDLQGSIAQTPAANDNDTSIATTAYAQTELTAYASDTATFTNKTLDAAATGNVLKRSEYIYLVTPHLAQGTNATINTTATSITYGHATFSNSVDQATNYVEYYIQVPEKLDTAVVPRARLKVLLGGADTGTHRYVLSSVSVADSAVPTASTLANAINIDFAGDGSGASGDVETSAWTSLTGWNSALTAGQTWRIRLARDGDTSDTSTVNSTELGLVIEYGETQ